ncbi:histidine ammonia-lyase-like [Ptychodera flava]|uniref:histidine ammonia-lyase-like n=1 Tax=Ptychodera flava TaxID=63121 RepID=UPI00396A9EC3
MADEQVIILDGNSLTTGDLVKLGSGKYKIKVADSSWKKVKSAREHLDSIIREGKVAYGINTGFGKFANVVVSPDKLSELQENLIRSHSSGVGEPLTPQKTRMLMALRINVLAKGHSGITEKVLHQYIDAFNVSCLPYVPEKGTVGASGDLAPLSHLALGMMGEGKMWSPKTGLKEAKEVLSHHGLEPITLGPKEGLALINGTQLITSIGVLALEKAAAIARQADVIAAMTLEVLEGTNKAFDSDIHKLRPHNGQQAVASRFRALLHSEVHPSEITKSHKEHVQDAYTLRCCPQVHGVVHDTIDFVRGLLTTETNSATDNPMIFPDRHLILSGGNFHGEYPAKALDYLAIGVHELANISERRIERLINPAYSEGLPAFLVAEGGLNSGFMIAHCTAAGLVSENKVLTHPSSVDSLSTSAGTEDHVSMGGFAARKALTVVEHVEQVLAIELLAACQGKEFRNPLKATEPLEKVYELVRSVARPWDKDRFMAPDIEAVTELLREEKVWAAVKPFIDNYERQMSS